MRKILKNVTLVSTNCVKPENSVKALLYSSKDIQFGRIILFSHYKPENITPEIDFINIGDMTHDDMSLFGLKRMGTYIDTEYILTIHDDGFIINPQNWTDEFLQYDYIGAPWPSLSWNQKSRVGNGGVSLRSKKLMDLCLSLPDYKGHDDVFITNTNHEFFISSGCKFPDITLAAKFSLEHAIPEVPYDLNSCFAFHGRLTQESRDKIKELESWGL